jgi:hypothetical protein
MNRNLTRPITEEETRTYDRDGVVWLRDILDLEFVTRLGKAIDELVESRADKPVDQVLDFTDLAVASTSDASTAASGPIEGPEWASPRQLAGRLAVDTRVKPKTRRGHFV